MTLLGSETPAPKVLVISCGGTIASTRSEHRARPELDASEVLELLPERPAGVEFITDTFVTILSSDMTIELVVRLHQLIQEHLHSESGINGVVVTHGTDTLEEVAFSLDLLWAEDIPLVVTGAMRSADSVVRDGPANLRGAIMTAIASGARGMGVLVVLNDQVHLARYVQKTHSANLDAFRSSTIGPVGYIAESVARIVFRPAVPGAHIDDDLLVAGTEVALLKTSIGDDGRILDHVLSAGYSGLVIEGFGGGHVSRWFAESSGLQSLLERVPVVLATRAGAGEPLTATYSGLGSETDMLARGVISAGPLDGPKSRVLLTMLLASGANKEDIARTFAGYAGRGVAETASARG